MATIRLNTCHTLTSRLYATLLGTFPESHRNAVFAPFVADRG
jgi:hypothetical protein